MIKNQVKKNKELRDMIFVQDVVNTNSETISRIASKLYLCDKITKSEYSIFMLRHGLNLGLGLEKSFSQIAKELNISVEEVLVDYNKALKLVSKSLVNTAFNLELSR